MLISMSDGWMWRGQCDNNRMMLILSLSLLPHGQLFPLYMLTVQYSLNTMMYTDFNKTQSIFESAERAL